MNRILLVEDDRAIVGTLTEYLTEAGFSVSSVSGKMQAERILGKEDFDLCLLDVTLSNGSGFDVCEIAGKKDIPVIFLTASGDENSVVRGLDMGAEDYIQKPFRPRELLSRVRRVIRKNSPELSPEISLGCGVSVNPEKGSVSKNGEELNLSALEYRLLSVFLQNRGKLLSREQLLWDIWDAGGDYVNDNTLTVYIKRLREKIEDDPQNPAIIRTVRGLGYRMDE
ncbi:MAG: response regulator transcription factor [Lachnospiraceae bacterium]|nr:response regulator transcription factor [Lachnospiraceae bacterium]